MDGAGGESRPAFDWRRPLVLGVALGVAPAIGREVADATREVWGGWPARLAGLATASLLCGLGWRALRPGAVPPV